MLTDRQVRTAKPRDKAYKLADRNSLFLHVSAKGHKSFRYKYRFDGKEQLLVIGEIRCLRLSCWALITFPSLLDEFSKWHC